jgi:hypothetical protein
MSCVLVLLMAISVMFVIVGLVPLGCLYPYFYI